MTLDQWLANAVSDTERRGLTGLRPLLEALAVAAAVLRTAAWNADASGSAPAADDDER